MDVLILLALTIIVLVALIALGLLFAIKDSLADIRRNTYPLVKQNVPIEPQAARDSETVCAVAGCDDPRLSPSTPFCKKHHAISA